MNADIPHVLYAWADSRRLIAMPSLVERRLERLDHETQHMQDLLQRMTECKRRAALPEVALTDAAARAISVLQQRLEHKPYILS